MVTVVEPLVVAKLLLTAKVVPLRVADPTDTAPINVVDPVAALVWVRAPVSVTASLNVNAPLLVTVKDVSGVVPPTDPVKVTVPEPLFILN